MTLRAVVPDIDKVEAEQEARPEPGIGMVMIAIPEPTYRALSDAAAKQQLTVAQLLSKAFKKAIEGDGHHG
jgi:hypothetical protein